MIVCRVKLLNLQDVPMETSESSPVQEHLPSVRCDTPTPAWPEHSKGSYLTDYY